LGIIASMLRYIRWTPIFFMTALIGLAASAPFWAEWLRPAAQEENTEAVFPCPPVFTPEICALLEVIHRENPLEAEAMIAALQADPLPAPADEADPQSIERGFDRNTFSVFSTTRVRTGQFTALDALHTASGTVNIWEIVADTQIARVLRFEAGFEVSRGPDLRVYLSISAEPRSAAELFAGDTAVEIGSLKGNIGAQNYPLPPEVDVTRFASVVIFSAQYGRVFSSAPLQQPLQ